MTQDFSEAFDEFNVTLVAGRFGWSDLTIYTRGSTVECRVSAVFSCVYDCLIEFGEALMDARPCNVRFFDEPGGHAWRLTPIASRLHMMRFQVYELDGHYVDGDAQRTDLRLKIDFVVKRQQLATMLVGELWKSAMLFHEPSYQQSRERFPYEDYQRLLRRWNDWMSIRGRLPDSSKL